MFSGSKIINITLVLIVLGLATIAFIKPEMLPSRHTDKLTDLSLDEINSITINNPEQLIQLEKRTDSWFVNFQNQSLPADEKLTSQILGLSQQLALSNFDNTKEDLEKYGFNSNDFSVKFNDTLISFGNNEPVANRHYVHAENKIHVVNSHLLNKLSLPITSFIDKSLIPPGQTVTNIKALWKQRPLIPLQTQKSKETLNNWQNASAQDIRTYNDQEAIAIVLIQTNSRNILEFNVIPSKNTLKLARKDLGIVYIIPKQYMAGLLIFERPGKSK